MTEQVEALSDGVDYVIGSTNTAAFPCDVVSDTTEFGPRFRCQAMHHTNCSLRRTMLADKLRTAATFYVLRQFAHGVFRDFDAFAAID